MQEKIIQRLHELGIPELKSITTLHELDGDYINLECILPNGKTGKLLDNNKKYLAAQVERTGNDKCYGIAADEKQIAVYLYSDNGENAELVLWVAL